MTKRYICPYCSAKLTHGQALTHVQYTCEQRPGTQKSKG